MHDIREHILESNRILRWLVIGPLIMALVILLAMIGYGGGFVVAKGHENWKATIAANGDV